MCLYLLLSIIGTNLLPRGNAAAHDMDVYREDERGGCDRSFNVTQLLDYMHAGWVSLSLQ